MMQDITGFTGTVIGGYRLERLIDTGGNGAVFLARQVDPPHEEAAVKVLIPQLLDAAQVAEQRARFVREARTLSKQLRHERILPVLISGEDAATNLAYMILPYMRNGTLAHRLSAGGPLALGDVARYITQIADALDYAHQHQVIHRDIKPSNVLLDDKEQAVLADFGIAKLFDSDITMHTSSDKTIGTAEYMSPEQAQGSNVGPASDIYSLGMLTYHLVTGQLPFPKTPAVATILVQTLTMPPASPTRYRPELPLPAEAAILRALSKNPAERFPTARAFANAFSLGVQGAYSAEITNSPTAAFAVPATTYSTPVSGVVTSPVLPYQPVHEPSVVLASPGPSAVAQATSSPGALLQSSAPTLPGGAQPTMSSSQPTRPELPSQPTRDKALSMPVITSGWAIASLVCSLLGIGLLGVIFGFVAQNEIRKSDGRVGGSGLAKAGIIIGFVMMACSVILVIASAASQAG
jgi:serine/threonine protein kinase